MSAAGFSIPVVVFRDGERFPMLVDATGSPDWYATLFATTQIRNAGFASNTIEAALSSVRHLLAWAAQQGVDLEQRFASRVFLKFGEIESIARYAQLRAGEKVPVSDAVVQPHVSPNRVVSRIAQPERRVLPETQYNRLSYMAEYLNWLAIYVIERESRYIDSEALDAIKLMGERIRSKRPTKRRKNVNARKGLSDAGLAELLAATSTDSSSNRFSAAVRARNDLIISLFSLGLRAGELLALKVSDFDFQKNEVLIARRHDDKDDPRARQPVVKTLDRLLPLGDALSRQVSNYVMNIRRTFPKARRHEFLIVTHQAGPYQGGPLSAKGLAKIFQVIRRDSSKELKRLSPHVLRHTANDQFSDLMDQAQVKEAEEEKLRSWIMGWREGSGTSATYTRRHTEKKAREASLKLQERSGGSGDPK